MALAARLPDFATTEPSPVAERLGGASRAVEGRFLQAGEVLAQAVDGLGGLVASLDQLAKTLDGEMVAATTAELEAAAAALLALPERHGGRRDAIARLASTGELLAGGIENMRRNMAYLRVFAINIKITAGGIAAAGEEFGDFAQEIRDCIELGRGQLDAFDGELQALRLVFTSAARHEAALAVQCEGLLPAVPDGLTAGAAAMVGHHRRIASAAEGVAALARAVQLKVGSALSGLQIGDITRQRIEHVSEALELFAATPGLSPDQQARMAVFLHGLLAAQIRSTADDFHRDVALLGEALQGIGADAAELLRLRDATFGKVDAGEEGFLRKLESDVGKALALVDDMARADSKAAELGGSAALAVTGLGERIASLQAMRTDVRHMALNTNIKSSRVGVAGKPLAVIAVELRAHADHMATSTQEALTALTALARDAGVLSGTDGAVEGARAVDVGAALSGATDRLKTAGDAVEVELTSLARQGEAVVEILRRAAGRLDFQLEIGAILDEAADAFAEQAGAEPPDIADVMEPLGALLSQILKRYTMSSERDVHRDFTAGLAFAADAAPYAAGPAATAAEDDQDMHLF
jgi:hypothetical protein